MSRGNSGSWTLKSRSRNPSMGHSCPGRDDLIKMPFPNDTSSRTTWHFLRVGSRNDSGASASSRRLQHSILRISEGCVCVMQPQTDSPAEHLMRSGRFEDAPLQCLPTFRLFLFLFLSISVLHSSARESWGERSPANVSGTVVACSPVKLFLPINHARAPPSRQQPFPLW